jgi:gluconate:H+ symporter, GntP family
MYTILLLLGSILFILYSITKLKLHPFLGLFITALAFGVLAGLPVPVIIDSIQTGFGGTIGKVGIIIILGTIIGTFLEESGGAMAIAEKILKVLGRKQVPLTLNLIGWLISIPVFADSAFVILSPLNRALAKKVGLSLAVTSTALAMGLMITHVLVPPTPGPIAAAGLLNADLGLVLLLGLPVSLIASLVGWQFAVRYGKNFHIDPDSGVIEMPTENKTPAAAAPSASKAFLPILIPILLIIIKSIASLPARPLGEGGIFQAITFVGEPSIALLLGVFLAFTLPRTLTKNMLSDAGWVGKALLNSAMIILVTGAGGAFGKVLQNSNLSDIISSGLSGFNLGIWLPFLISVALRSAQGSATVAMVTTASLISPLMPALGLDSDMARACVVLAIGAGSLVVSHVNDSFFWIFSQMVGVDVKTCYKLITLGTLVIGLTAAVLIWLLSMVII